VTGIDELYGPRASRPTYLVMEVDGETAAQLKPSEDRLGVTTSSSTSPVSISLSAIHGHVGHGGLGSFASCAGGRLAHFFAGPLEIELRAKQFEVIGYGDVADP
jgi:hypothetical protein